MGNGCCNCLGNNQSEVAKASEAEIAETNQKYFVSREREAVPDFGSPVHAEDQHSEVNYSAFLKECDVRMQENKLDFSQASPKHSPLSQEQAFRFDKKLDEQFLSQNSLNKIYSTFERDPARTSCETLNHPLLTEHILANNSLEDKLELFRNALLKPAMKKTVLKNGPLKPPTMEYLGKQNPFREMRSEHEIYFGQVDALDRKEGFGLQYNLKNEEYFEGHFEADLRFGPGNLYLSNGEYFSGVWNNEQLEGEGSQVKPNQYMYARLTRYRGFWEHGIKKGFGEERDNRGTKYPRLTAGTSATSTTTSAAVPASSTCRTAGLSTASSRTAGSAAKAPSPRQTAGGARPSGTKQA